MRNGRSVVFLSCSVRFQTEVAEPIRDELASNGVDAIIVSLERIPRNADWDPDTKVDKYLEQSDVFVALATPDDFLSDGTLQVRANVVDEITRAKRLPHLRDRSLVFREPSVHLHSNVNPAHEPLSLDNPGRVVPVILEQMREWGVLPLVASPASVEDNPSATTTSTDQSPLQRAVNLALDGLKLADWPEARRRAYLLVTTYKRSGIESFIECLTQMILEMPSDSDELHPAVTQPSVHVLDPTRHAPDRSAGLREPRHRPPTRRCWTSRPGRVRSCCGIFLTGRSSFCHGRDIRSGGPRDDHGRQAHDPPDRRRRPT